MKLPKQAPNRAPNQELSQPSIQSQFRPRISSPGSSPINSTPRTLPNSCQERIDRGRESTLTLSLPKDPAPHILRALALDLIDRKNSALRSLDLALSFPCVKSLLEKKRGDALVKRPS
ncbi:hypothetical protein FEM48_Zijuj09G0091000 [Ziziphus jujuba var. spinosa]|uniref:Uncharacterized protein n=1 Tax=Ziziphus jujuba var. spinosa TaxID=714518 RepID=A0A978US38_ZIZJJ|nr:hypothetical protein FEM48_Zijuj09G0091000 [Ziziphus jujuba var. spinosa]